MAGASTRWMGTLFRGGAVWAWARRGLALTAIAAATAVGMGACGGGDDELNPPDPGTTGGGGPGGGTSSGGPCTEGATRECHVTIGEHDGVLTCLDGVETCEGGTWGGCIGVTRTRTMPQGAPEAQEEPGEGQYPIPMSLTDAGPCVGNPCDPSCQSFDEDPGPGGVTIESSGPTYAWSVGDINALPESVLDLGTQQPCSTAEDCQFDQYCDNPSDIACSHSLCATGQGLYSTCSACAQKICNADTTCCIAEYPGPCDHDPCTGGNALKRSCDPCVVNVCNAKPICCTTMCTTSADCVAEGIPGGSTCDGSGRCRCPAGGCPTGFTCVGTGATSYCNPTSTPTWGSSGPTSCVAQVPLRCAPKTCPTTANTWQASCVSKVASVCGDSCDATSGTCAHNKCYTGTRLSPSSCDACVNLICTTPAASGGDSTCCTGQWTQSCVNKVKTLCGQDCPAKGVCTTWRPDEKDPNCTGVDLTLGVPCGGHVPICNRGTAAVAAGTTIDIASWPAGSGKMPSSDPTKVLNSCNPGAGTTSCTITLAQSLAGGQCVNVTTCAGMSDGREIMVNPAGAHHVNECHCENNWSVWQSAACTSPGCVAPVSVSFVKKVTMYLSVDTSRSMAETGTGTCINPPSSGSQYTNRWQPMTDALKSFFSDSASAGLGVALRFWPDVTTTYYCNDSPFTCPVAPTPPNASPGTCGVPHVALGDLTAAAAPTDTQEQALINALNARLPCRDTPTSSALDGAEAWAIYRKVNNPTEEVVVVFITDGIPNGCNTDFYQIAALSQNAFLNYGVRTYVIGFGNASSTLGSLIASYGGGTPFNLSAGPTLQTAILDALKAIRGELLPCDISIPPAGVPGPTNPTPQPVTVHYTSGTGVDTTLTKVANAASCGNGWYVDPTNPANAKLCPATCSSIQADPGAEVQAVAACTLTPKTYTQTYHADCPQGSKVQWGYLTYDSTTPGDSSVVFDLRTADTTADLNTAATHNAATAHATPTNTQVCTTGQVPPCSVDLYNKLNKLPDARKDYLRLTMTLNPTSDGQLAPTVHDWEITYSCPDSE